MHDMRDYDGDEPKHDAREAIRFAIENQKNTIEGLEIQASLADERAAGCRRQIKRYKEANEALRRQLDALDALVALEAVELEPVQLPKTKTLPNGDTVRVEEPAVYKPTVFKATKEWTKVGREPAILRPIGSDRQVDYLGIAHSVIGG
jgi:hypothetical protein